MCEERGGCASLESGLWCLQSGQGEPGSPHRRGLIPPLTGLPGLSAGHQRLGRQRSSV